MIPKNLSEVKTSFHPGIGAHKTRFDSIRHNAGKRLYKP